MVTITDQIEDGDDDANEQDASKNFNMQRGEIDIAIGDSKFRVKAGLRFAHVDWASVPNGATVTAATLEFLSAKIENGSFGATLYAEDNATPATFGSADSDISDRVLTTASGAAGSIELGGSWGNNDQIFFGTSGTIPTTAVVDVLQEVFDTHGTSIDAIVLIFDHDSGSGQRKLDSFDTSEADAAQIALTYTVSAGADTLGPPTTAALTTSAAAPVVAVPLTASSAVEVAFMFATTFDTEFPVPLMLAVAEGIDGTLFAELAQTLITEPASAPVVAVPFTADAAITTLTTAAVTTSAEAGFATLQAGGVGFQDYGTVQRNIVRAEYGTGVVFYLEAILKTQNASFAAKARLVDTLDSSTVPGSEVSTTSTTLTRVRSNSFSLSGDKTYKVQYGGDIVAIYSCDNAQVLWDWSD